jgi:hypothetical protein
VPNGAWCRDHALPAANEKLVVTGQLQPLQYRTHGGLAQANAVGGAHWFSHARRMTWKPLLYLQQLFKIGHRPHHFIGTNDGKGEISVTQTSVEHSLFWFIMPNFLFQFICLYLGLTEIFLFGTAFKGLWAAHNHVNWNYDLYFLNHRRAWVRKTMYVLCHVLTFPTQHHHHHARGKNSAKSIVASRRATTWRAAPVHEH